MAQVHALPAVKAAGSLQHVSTVFSSLLAKAGYDPIDPEKEALATAAVTLLSGSYRRDDAALPEIFTEAMIAVLARYPEDCIRAVTDPRSGIQSALYAVFDHNGREVKGRFKSFPPNVGELQEACERWVAKDARRKELASWGAEAAEARRRWAAEDAERTTRPTLPELCARVARVDTAPFDDLAARIAGQIEHGTRTRRVEAECEARRARREAA